MRILATILCAYGTLAYFEAQAQQEPAHPEPSVQPERPQRPAPPGAALGRADANHDGKVSFEELLVLRPRMDRADCGRETRRYHFVRVGRSREEHRAARML